MRLKKNGDIVIYKGRQVSLEALKPQFNDATQGEDQNDIAQVFALIQDHIVGSDGLIDLSNAS